MAWQKKARVVDRDFRDRVHGDRGRRLAAPQAAASGRRRFPNAATKTACWKTTQSGHFAVYERRQSRVFDEVGAQCSYPDGRIAIGQRRRDHLRPRTASHSRSSAARPRYVQSGDELKTGALHRTVKLTSEGTEVTTEDATYNQAGRHAEGPRGRRVQDAAACRAPASAPPTTSIVRCSGCWLKPHVTVAADDKGQGALDATAEAIGMARADHYLKLTRHRAHQRRRARHRRRRNHDPADRGRSARAACCSFAATAGSPAAATAAARRTCRPAISISRTPTTAGRSSIRSWSRTRSSSCRAKGKRPGKRIAGKTIDIAHVARRKDRDQPQRAPRTCRSICPPTATRRRNGFDRQR